MHIRQIFIIIVILSGYSSIFGQTISCLDWFDDFEMLEPDVNPTARNQSYLPTMVWYEDCILVGSNDGLWLYDPNQPDRPIQLAHVKDRAINHIAVNPRTFEIAFNVAQEPIVYLIESDKNVSSLRAAHQALTAIAFSQDGSSLAVASFDFIEEFISDSSIRIWNLTNRRKIEDIPALSEISFIPNVFFSNDNQHLLVHEVKSGYIGGDQVVYWNIDTGLQLWNYVELLDSLQPRTTDDPLAITTIAMQGDIVAFGGLDGYLNDRNFYGYGVHFWNTETQQRLTKIRVQDHYDEQDIYSLPYLMMAFDNHKSMLATSLGDDSVKIWDIEASQQLSEFIVQSSPVHQLLMNANTGLLAVLSGDSLTIFDLEVMQEITSFKPIDADSSG